MPGLHSVTSLMLVNSGSRYELKHEFGAAHFLEHLVAKGTAKYPDQLSLTTALDRVGADFNAFTSKEYTGFFVNLASQHFSLSLEVLQQLLLYPKLDPMDLEGEKSVILEEIKLHHDQPLQQLAQLFEQMVFQGSGLSHDISGTNETVNKMQPQTLTDFLNYWYGLSNMTLVLAGDAKLLKAQQTLELVKTFFSQQPVSRKNHQRIKLDQFLQAQPFGQERLIIEQRPIQQASFILGWPAIKRADPRRYALSLLSVVLGGNMSSRLFDQLRTKKGLCYFVNTSVDQYHDGGVFTAQAGVSPAKIEQAIKLTVQEFNDLVSGQKPVTQAELQKAKDYLSGKIYLSLEDSSAVAQFFGLRQLLLGQVSSVKQTLAKIRQVSLNEVQELAQELVQPKQLRLALIGPFSKEQKTSIKKLIK